MNLQRPTYAPKGFSLVEVMVALAVVAVGLLGIAKMEALSLASTGSASMRSLAALEAASFAASMHANRDYWTAGALTTTVTNDAAGNPTFVTTDGTLQAQLGAVPDCLQGGATPCSTAQLAAYDLNEWAAALAQLLPSAAATISCPNLIVPRSCTIQISWQENAVGVNAQETATAQANAAIQAAAFQSPVYTLYVEP